MFWLLAFILLAATTTVSALLRPRPKIQSAQPSSLGDFQAPTAEEGRVVPVIFGTVKMKGPNVTWFGDLRIDPLKQQDQVTGYFYNLGMQMALCHGPVDELIDIVVAEKSLAGAIGGGMNPAPPYLRPAGSVQNVSLTAIHLFGVPPTGEGGIGSGPSFGNDKMRFYFGAQDQGSDAYLSSAQAFGETAPPYRGICHVVCEHVYVGTSNYIKPWAFVMRRCPDRLCRGGDVVNINGGANPAEMIYEIMTNPIWGMARPASRIDADSFEVVAQTLKDEGMGLNLILDNPNEADQVIEDILRHIDGVLYTDPATGLFTLKLARADYDPDDLIELTPEAVPEAPEFTRGNWNETINEVKIEYTDRAQDFTKRPVQAQETANFAITGRVRSETVPFLGVGDAETAQKLAMRVLRTLSYPLARVSLKANRKAWRLRIGGVFKLTWAPLGITEMVLRITNINYGSLENGQITIDAVEDIFGIGETGYTFPTGSKWTEPVQQAEIPDAQVAIEAPYQLLDTTTAAERVKVGAARGDRTSKGFKVLADEGSGYHETNSANFFTPSGLLAANYSRMTDALDAVGFDLESGRDLEIVAGTDAPGRDRGDCLLMFTDGAGVPTEICAFTAIENNEDGTFTMSGIVRGVYDTVPIDHADGERVWIIRDDGIPRLLDYMEYLLDTDGAPPKEFLPILPAGWPGDENYVIATGTGVITDPSSAADGYIDSYAELKCTADATDNNLSAVSIIGFTIPVRNYRSAELVILTEVPVNTLNGAALSRVTVTWSIADDPLIYFGTQFTLGAGETRAKQREFITLPVNANYSQLNVYVQVNSIASDTSGEVRVRVHDVRVITE